MQSRKNSRRLWQSLDIPANLTPMFIRFIALSALCHRVTPIPVVPLLPLGTLLKFIDLQIPKYGILVVKSGDGTRIIKLFIIERQQDISARRQIHSGLVPIEFNVTIIILAGTIGIGRAIKSFAIYVFALILSGPQPVIRK